MELQTSFIPKRSLDTSSSVHRADTVSIFTVLSTLVFFVSIIGAGGIFFWQQTLQSDIKIIQSQLQSQKDKFDERSINELTALDQRLNVSAQLLNNHMYSSKILELLQKNTVQTVRYNKFSVDPNQTDKKTLKITLSGQAKDYASIALQSYVFGKIQNAVVNFEFSNLTLDQSGNVLFDLSATVERDITAFEHLISTADISANLAPVREPASNNDLPPPPPNN